MNFLKKVYGIILDRWHKETWRAAFLLTFFSFASRGFGMIKRIMVYHFMTPLAGDLLVAADNIPSDLTQLLVNSVITASLLPILTRINTGTKDEKNTSEFLYSVMVLMSFLVFIGSIVFVIFTPQILELRFVTSPKIIQEFREQGVLSDYILITRILMVGPILFTLRSVLSSYLYLKKRFFVLAIGGVFYNFGAMIGLFAGFLFLDGRSYIGAVIGMVLATLFNVIIIWQDTIKSGFLFWKNLKSSIFNIVEFWTKIKNKFQQEIFKLLSLSFSKIWIVDTSFISASLIVPLAQYPGQITALDIGTSIMASFFILSTSFGSVVFPNMAVSLNNDDVKIFWKKIDYYLKQSFLIGLFVSVITMFGSPVVMWAFELLGKGQDNGRYIILITQICGLSLSIRSVEALLQKYLSIREKVWSPSVLSIFRLIAQILFSLYLYNLGLDSGINMAWGIVFGSILWVLLAFIILQKDRKLDFQKIKKVNV
jgi:peptidoglycan biosynthesis protein MviN/MurJ (putative lipid II flippase)